MFVEFNSVCVCVYIYIIHIICFCFFCFLRTAVSRGIYIYRYMSSSLSKLCSGYVTSVYPSLSVSLSHSLSVCLCLSFSLGSFKSHRGHSSLKSECVLMLVNYTFEEHKQTLPSVLPLRSVTAPSLWSLCLLHVHKAMKTEEHFASFALMERELFGFMLREDKLWPWVL